MQIGIMPKPWGYTKYLMRYLWHEKRLLGRLFLATTALAILLFGATQQDQYVAVTTALNDQTGTVITQNLSTFDRLSLLVGMGATGGFNGSMSETQKVYFTFLYVLIGLTTVWLLRHRLAGNDVKVRDGLYSASGPVVAVAILFLIAILQLLPLTIAIITYSAAVTSGILNGVFEKSLFIGLAALLAVGSLYWVMSTVVAAMIASNPGTYPLAALKAAKKVVVGRRVRLMIHLLWLALLLVVLWAAILILATIVDNWIHQQLLPFTVGSIQLLTSFSVIFGAAYVYLLYRKMIDESAN